MSFTEIKILDLNPIYLKTGEKLNENDLLLTPQIPVYGGETEGAYKVTSDITNGTLEGVGYVGASETVKVVIVPDEGYELPTTIFVTGAAYEYNPANGEIEISLAMNTVSIEAECSEALPKLDAVQLRSGSGYLYDDPNLPIWVEFDTPTDPDAYTYEIEVSGMVGFKGEPRTFVIPLNPEGASLLEGQEVYV